jgi:hypothetical protein
MNSRGSGRTQSELRQETHDIAVLFRRNGGAANDPGPEIDILAVENPLVTVELGGRETVEVLVGEVAEHKVDLLGPAMPATKAETLAANVGVVCHAVLQAIPKI